MVRLGEGDLPRLRDLCLSCTAFFQLIAGAPASDTTAAEIVGPVEPAYAHGTKHLWGVEQEGGKLLAAAELLQNHPSAGEWYIGLLLVVPELRRNRIGTRFFDTLLAEMARQGATTVRLIVHQQNVDARRFWEQQGFSPEREVIKRSGRLEGPVTIFRRSVVALV